MPLKIIFACKEIIRCTTPWIRALGSHSLSVCVASWRSRFVRRPNVLPQPWWTHLNRWLWIRVTCLLPSLSWSRQQGRRLSHTWVETFSWRRNCIADMQRKIEWRALWQGRCVWVHEESPDGSWCRLRRRNRWLYLGKSSQLLRLYLWSGNPMYLWLRKDRDLVTGHVRLADGEG